MCRTFLNVWFFFSVLLLGRKSGVLTVKILELHEECTVQVAVCEQLAGPPTTSPPRGTAAGLGACLKVLFTRETADHLRGHPQDIIYIFPPWWVQQAESSRQLCICLVSGRHFTRKSSVTLLEKCQGRKAGMWLGSYVIGLCPLGIRDFIILI